MKRFVVLAPAVALGLGTVLATACSFTLSTAPFYCDVSVGSATVNMPANMPDVHFDDVSRNYHVTANCTYPDRKGNYHKLAVTADAGYYPANHKAHEVLLTDDPNDHLTSDWTCDGDPWLSAGVACTQIDAVGVMPAGYDQSNGTLPVSAEYLDVHNRATIAQMLWEDFARKNQNPCTFNQSSLAARIVAPLANHTYTYPADAQIPLNVQRTQNCSDGIAPVFDLQWQLQDYQSGTFSDKPVLAQFSGTANPSGTTVAFTTFVNYQTVQIFNTWRVRARLSGQPNAPWSDWSVFNLAQ
jgi:hypothetical protein